MIVDVADENSTSHSGRQTTGATQVFECGLHSLCAETGSQANSIADDVWSISQDNAGVDARKRLRK